MEKRSSRRKKEKSLLFAVLIILLVVFGFGEIITIYCFNAKIMDELEAGKLTVDAAWGASMIENIIGIISLAVSVWLGLNLYEIYKKTDADNLIDKLEETNQNMLNESFRRKFLLQLEATVQYYEISNYFYEQFSDCNEITDDFLKQLYEVESQFRQCCFFYEMNKKEKSYYYADRTEKELEDLADYLKKYKVEEDNILYQYYYVRLADVYFYKKNRNSKELQESIELYIKEIQLLRKNNTDKELTGYMENTIGYTYLILENDFKSEKKDVDWLEEAYKYLTLAIEHNGKGRYYQNLGSYYEKKSKYEEAYKQYINAFKSNVQAKKIYNLLGSVCLRIVDEKLKVNNRFDRGELLCDITKKKIKRKKLLQIQQWIKDGYNWLSVAARVPNTVENSYYNYAKACYYYYFFVQADKDILQTADIYLRLCEQIGVEEKGYAYTLRNYYEIMGKLGKAKKINETLIMRDKNGKIVESMSGDAVKVRKLYEKQ